jgi:surface carbohydrate biosynthesis protein
MNNLDILNLEWPNSERDLNISTPVIIYLRKKYNLKCEIKSIFNGYYYLLKYRPKLLILSNFQGAIINNEIVKLAYNQGIKVVTLISEGSVNREELQQFLWGWNNDNALHVDKMLLWSEYSKNIFLEKYPEIESKTRVVGGTGFDRYSLLNFKTKESFLLKESKQKYKKIIGIAAWGFDILYGDYYETHKDYFEKTFGAEQVEMHKNDLLKLQVIYEKIVEKNKDILFILRYHPVNTNLSKSEFFNLSKHENIFFSKKYDLHDLINISDLWIGYTTTTALEAWLLGKQTFLINPTRADFIRESVYKGSPIASNKTEVQLLIDEYYLNGSIEAFQSLESERKKIIKDVIGFDDGKNHVRAAEEIIKVLEQPDRKVKYKFKIYKEAFKQILKIILSKTIFRKRWPELDYKRDFAKPYKEAYDKVIG